MISETVRRFKIALHKLEVLLNGFHFIWIERIKLFKFVHFGNNSLFVLSSQRDISFQRWINLGKYLFHVHIQFRLSFHFFGDNIFFEGVHNTR